MARRIGYIDGLRAIAVLSVLIEHASIGTADPAKMPGFLLRCGMHGVDLFFVISGFCLSYPTLAALHQKGQATFDVGAFACRRIVRIVPPYYVAIAALAAAAVFVGARLNASDILAQLLFFDRGGQAHMLNSSFWTLPVEFRWYVLFPLLLYIWTRSRRAFALIAILAACSTATKAWSEDILILPAFMMGIVAADLQCARPRWAVFSLPLAACLAALGMFTTPANWDNYAYPTWQAAALFFVVAAGSVPVVTKILSMRVLSQIGVASYSIYLVHGPVIDFALRHGAYAPVAGAAGLTAGFLFWFVAERPFVEGPLRERISNELRAFIPRWITFAGLPLKAQLRRLETAVDFGRRAVPLTPVERTEASAPT
jgi:peptidoglycan/LPS O-acetylase OafA/YrhL